MTILQSLTAFYERLDSRGDVPRNGYARVGISFVIPITKDGGVRGANRVTALPGDWHEDRVVLTLEDKARRLSEVITTTPEHPFHVAGQGFVAAGQLKSRHGRLPLGAVSITVTNNRLPRCRSRQRPSAGQGDHDHAVGSGEMARL